MKSSVIVVGAGAAGLMAACELVSKGFAVTVVEASARIGGRIHTVYQDGLPPMELGAEFIHGDLPLTMDLLRQAGISYAPALSTMYRVKQGKWQETEEEIEGWDELEEKIKNHPEDITLEKFLELYFSDERYEKFRASVLGMAEGLDLANSDKVSIRSLWDEWSHEQEEIYYLPGGYAQLIEYMATTFTKQGGEIIRNFCVSKVSWQKDAVRVSMADGSVLEANKVILTVPVSVLQANRIAFSPAIPQVREAVSDIGWGKVIKFLVKFNENLSSKEDLGLILSDEIVPTWWAQTSEDSSFLTGWLGGPKAAGMEGVPEELLRGMALRSLSGIFDLPLEVLETKLEFFKAVRWSTEPFIGGGYSYDTPKSTAAKQLLQASVEETIFFAGEGVYTGSSKGTVEAALVSGKDVAALM